ncbi:hypothetical protein AbraIFM66950_001838 [Aspergillus brasiliensis]|nr:hypothetical protein AbraIFM66950_001838 [Aspergillus brasiliensis]
MSGRRIPITRRVPIGGPKQITAAENDPDGSSEYDDNIAQQLAEARHKALELDRENKRLTSQVHDLNQVLVEREQAFAQSEQELRQTQRDLKAIENESRTKEDHVKAAETANNMLNVKNDAQAGQIRRIRQEYKKLKDEETYRSGENEKLQQQILDASRELEELKQKLALKELESAAQKVEMEQLAQAVDKYKGNDTVLRTQLNRLAEQVHTNEQATVVDPPVVQPTNALETALIRSTQNKQMQITSNPFVFQNPSLTLRQELGGSLYSRSQSTASSGALSSVGQRGSVGNIFNAPLIPAQNSRPPIEAVPVDWSNIQQAAKTGAIPHVEQALVPSPSLKRPFAGLEAWQGFDGSAEAIKKLRVAADQQQNLGSNTDNSFLAIFQKYMQTLQEATNQKQSQEEQLDMFKKTVQALTAQGNTSLGNQSSTSQSSWIQDYQKAAAQAANDPSKPEPRAIVTAVKQPKESQPKKKPRKFLTRGPNYQWPVYLDKRYKSTPLTVPPFRTTRKKFANFSTPGAYDEDDQTDAIESESMWEFETPPEGYYQPQASVPQQAPIPPAVILAWVLIGLVAFLFFLFVKATFERFFAWMDGTQDIWMRYNEVPEYMLATVRGRGPPDVGLMPGLDYRLAKFVDIRSHLVG